MTLHRLWMWITGAAIAAACSGSTTSAPAPLPEPTTPKPAAPKPSATKPLPAVPLTPAPTGRLGEDVVPRAYELTMEMNPDSPTFRGTIIIDLEVRKPTRSVWLHARDLTVTKARIDGWPTQQSGSRLSAPAGSELLGLGFAQTIPAGRSRLTIEFSGRFGTIDGAFRQRHGRDWYAYTDFEPTDARKAFPCFDDPRFKVPWTVHLIIPEHLRGFANGPITATKKLPNKRKRLSFARTRPMSSYLVAFAAGPFEVVDGAAKPVPIRIITMKGTAARAKRSLAAIPVFMKMLQDYFGSQVPYPKMDFIAVPRFSGAMENPGLITVAARILLRRIGARSPTRERLYAIVASHELAHLWFGDLVTMNYWNDLWLNEAFATWMSDKIVARWKPSMETLDEEVALRNDTMQLDARLATRAIRQPIRTKKDIHAAFDAITYRKGGAVLAMFESWLGETVFRNGVRRYINQHKDGNATAEDLMKALSTEAKRDVTPVFNSFLAQSGVPLIEVALTCAAGKGTLSLRQSRYLTMDQAAIASKTAKARRWSVPVCARYGRGAKTRRACAVVDGRATMSLELCPTWVHPNAIAGGYYRYVLPTKLLKAAARAKLDGRELVDLIGNTDALLRSGQIELADAMPILSVGARSKRRNAITSAMDTFEHLGRTVIGKRQRRRYRATIRRLFGKHARRLGFARRPGEPGNDTELRGALVAFVGEHGADPVIRARARQLATKWLKRNEGVAPTMVPTTLRVAASAGGAALFDLMEAELGKTKNLFRRWAIVRSFAFPQPKLVRRAVELALSDKVSVANGILILHTLLRSPITRDVAWAHLRPRSAALAKRLPGPAQGWAAYLPRLVVGLCSNAHAAQAEAFLGGILRQSSKELTAALADIKRCAGFTRRHAKAAARVFK